MDIFKNLSEKEIEQVYQAPALVTILIGASDGKLDGEERSWSEKLLRTRSYAAQADLQKVLSESIRVFLVQLQHELSVLPQEVEQRNAAISERLARLNPIFESWIMEVAYGLYKGLIGLAAETAKASGGFLRIGPVSAAGTSGWNCLCWWKLKARWWWGGGRDGGLIGFLASFWLLIGARGTRLVCFPHGSEFSQFASDLQVGNYRFG